MHRSGYHRYRPAVSPNLERIFGLVHYFSHKATQTEPSGANCRSAVPVEHAEFPHKGPENW